MGHKIIVSRQNPSPHKFRLLAEYLGVHVTRNQLKLENCSYSDTKCWSCPILDGSGPTSPGLFDMVLHIISGVRPSMMHNDQFGWWEKSICSGLVNQLLSKSQVYIKKFFLSNYWNPMFFSSVRYT